MPQNFRGQLAVFSTSKWLMELALESIAVIEIFALEKATEIADRIGMNTKDIIKAIIVLYLEIFSETVRPQVTRRLQKEWLMV